MNFQIIVVSQELAVIPNKVSSVNVEGEIWQTLTWLNQSKTFWVNNLVNTRSMNECLVESFSLQYRHAPSSP